MMATSDNSGQVARAVLLVGLLAITGPVQVQGRLKSLRPTLEDEGSSVSELDSFESRGSSSNSRQSEWHDLPSVFDWRSYRSVVDRGVGNGTSLESWAYAAVAALEGQQAKLGIITQDQLVRRLNVTELLEHWDNDTSTVTTWPFKYVYENGLSLRDQCDKCTSDGRLLRGKRVFKKAVTRRHREFPLIRDLLRLVYTIGPLMVGLDEENIRDSSFGLPSECVESRIVNHFVLLTGFDFDHQQVLIFKNSWGERWGANGRGAIKFKENCNPFSSVVY